MRVEFLPAEEILAEFARLAVPVQKTGGDAEIRAFGFLQDYVRAATCTVLGEMGLGEKSSRTGGKLFG